MRHTQQRFPIDVRTGWVDYSPALRHHATQRVRSSLAAFAPQIRSVTVRISDDEAHHNGQRRCEIEVVTTHAGPISASAIGANLFTLVDLVLGLAVQELRKRTGGRPLGEVQQRIA